MKQDTRSHYVAGCENLCHDYWRFSDTWHLTAEYYEEIGRKLSHEYDTYVTVSSNLPESGSGYVSVLLTFQASSDSYIKMRCYQNDNMIHICMKELFI